MFPKDNAKDENRSDHILIIETENQDKSLSESLSSIQNALSNCVNLIIQSQLDTQKQLQTIITQLAEGLKNLSSLQFDGFNNLVESLSKSFEELDKVPGGIRKALIKLCQEGWYFDLELPISELWDWENEIEISNTKSLENKLIMHFQTRIDDIENFCIEHYPKRVAILRSAFAAHKRRDYYSSIPVLLTQIDGICYQETGYYFFSRDNQKPQISNFETKNVDDTFLSAMLSPLSFIAPIVYSKKERQNTFNDVNRHLVIHGESLDYGKEVNSLKIISLLNYVVQVFNFQDQ